MSETVNVSFYSSLMNCEERRRIEVPRRIHRGDLDHVAAHVEAGFEAAER